MLRFVTATVLVMLLTVSLAGCESAEERAEEYYQNSLALIEQGDVDRAIVELRNVFQLNGSHKQARETLARLLLEEKSDYQGAYGQFLRLAEQYPDDLEARIELTEIAFRFSNWEEFERHGSKAAELAPDDPRVKAIDVTLNYRKAAVDDDAAARRESARAAEELLQEQPENVALRNIVVDNHLREGNLQDALKEIDWILERQPDNQQLWKQRMNVLARLNDMDALEDQLREMVTRFPDDAEHKTTLLRFYMSRQETDKAEAFLRQLVAESDESAPRVDLIRFLAEVRGADAAREELQKAIRESDNPALFRVIGAGLDFQAGNREQAIAEMEAVLESAEPSEQTRDIKVTLAQMLLGTGNEVGARAVVEEVLAEEPTEHNALKMQAAWQIEADETDAAISALRTALDQEPDDSDAMTLMAQAYMRAGQPELARDFLALAVDASGNAPQETIRYASRLIGEERYLPAEDILLAALRLAPQHVDLLLTLGQLYLEMEDLGRVDQVVRTLRQIDTEVANRGANGLEAERINRQSGPEEAIAYLEGIADEADAPLAAKIALVRARIGTGDLEAALELARELHAENPGNQALTSMLAATEAVNGNLETAETLYRGQLEQSPANPALWLELSRLKARQGDPEAAHATIEEGLAAVPGNPNLLWAQASYLEQNGDIDGAIDIYEDLYEVNSNAMVVANNLASLLSTYRDDEESLERAWTIARRFRDADVPALQDTYGWILERRGQSEEALTYLEAAAEGLSNDALVQYHLGRTYLSLGRTEDALAQFRRTAELAGPSDQRAQIVEAREQIQTLQDLPEETE